jgi:hypothetical protein
VPDGALPREKVASLLHTFYRLRPEGPTPSGSYLHNFPKNEYKFIMDLYPEDDPSATIEFHTLLDALMSAQSARQLPPALTANPAFFIPFAFCANILTSTILLLLPHRRFRGAGGTARVRVEPCDAC